MLGADELLDRPHLDDFPAGEGGDAITDRVQAIQIVRHHKDGEAERLLQGRNQGVEIAG